MRKFAIPVTLLCCLLFGALSTVARASQEPLWKQGVKDLARLQALIEYYYIEAGMYPRSIEALVHSFNVGLPESAPKVLVGPDPVTGQPFFYKPAEDYQSYTLTVSDATKYGDNAVVLSQVDWAWVSIAAKQRRIERLGIECAENLDALATRVELYAKDHNKAFPADLEALKPRYLPRTLACPTCGKPYQYQLAQKLFTISCPNPEAHRLKRFCYQSDKGLLIEELTPSQPSDSSKAAPTDAVTLPASSGERTNTAAPGKTSEIAPASSK